MHPKIRNKIEQILTTNEEIEFSIAQQTTIFNWIPDYIIVTNRRLIVYHVQLFGARFVDLLWIDLQDVHLRENWLSSTFIIKHMNGTHKTIDILPKDGARHLYRITQELEENARKTRREFVLEESRAGANSTIINNASITPNPSQEPRLLRPASVIHEISSTQKLKDLRDMVDEELITKHEYEIKKIQILKDL